ncbi:MAG: hypothetical protein AB1453_04980 [Chloroflexota bacterium]|jgi:hypothetical protein
MAEKKNRMYEAIAPVSPAFRLEEAEFKSQPELRARRECLTARPPNPNAAREDLLNRLIEAIKSL